MNTEFIRKVFVSIAGAICLLPAFAWAGGSVSGGGGGTLPTNPVGPVEIEGILRESRGPLLMYFRRLDRGSTYGTETRLFNGSPNIYDVIEHTPIEAVNGPCFDYDGNEVDGSVQASMKGAICISLSRLGAKLEQSNAFSQTIALVAHELSHKLDFDEPAAERLQRDLLYRFEHSGVTAEVASNYSRQISQFAADAASATDWFIKFEDTHDWNQFCRQARWLEDQYKKFTRIIYDGPLALSIVPRRFRLHYEYGTKAFGLRVAACGQADEPLRDHLDDYVYQEYSGAFAGKEQLTVREFSTAMWGVDRDVAGGSLPIRLVSSGAVAKIEAEEIREYLHEIGNNALDLSKPAWVVVR